MTEIPEHLLKRSKERRGPESAPATPLPDHLLARSVAAREKAETGREPSDTVDDRVISLAEAFFNSPSLFSEHRGPGVSDRVTAPIKEDNPELDAMNRLSDSVGLLTDLLAELFEERVLSGRVALNGSVTLDFNGEVPEVRFDDLTVAYSATAE